MKKDFWMGAFSAFCIMAFMVVMYVAFNRADTYQAAADARHSAGAAQQAEHRLTMNEGYVPQEGED